MGFRSVTLAALVAVGGCAVPVENEDPAETEAAIAFVPPPAYAEGKLVSDLTPEIVARLREIRPDGRPDVFVKVGDSITVSESFLRCFETRPPALDADLEETRTFFARDAWSRATLAARVGAHTNEPLAGSPSPLDREIAAMDPSYAVVMLGTNDVFEGTEPTYERNLKRLVEALVARRVVPILSTIPPMRDAGKRAIIVKMNRVVRKVAAEARVPLMDFHLAVRDLPRFGLSGDGVHPFQAATGACDFRGVAMDAGYNQRNLLTLRALDATRRALAP